jgi:hypothetical protein
MKEASVQSKNRQQVLLMTAITLVGLWAGYNLLFTRVKAAWKGQSDRIAQLQVQLNQGRSRLAQEQIIRSRWESLRRNALPSDSSAAEQKFFQAVDRWASDSRVSITAITPQWKRDADDYMTYQARVETSGNLSALSRFLFEMEKDPLALKLEAVELGTRDKEGKLLSMAVQASALVLNPPAK